MSTLLTLADSCNPSLPGCQPENTGHPILVGLILVGFAMLLVMIGAAILIVFLVRRGNQQNSAAIGATLGSSGAQLGGHVPAGWFPDPTGRNAWRWWDGQSWTNDVSDGRRPGTDV